jgi:hypothetical protein
MRRDASSRGTKERHCKIAEGQDQSVSTSGWCPRTGHSNLTLNLGSAAGLCCAGGIVFTGMHATRPFVLLRDLGELAREGRHALADCKATLTFDSFNVRAELAALTKESKELEELVGAEDDSIRDFDSVLRR